MYQKIKKVTSLIKEMLKIYKKCYNEYIMLMKKNIYQLCYYDLIITLNHQIKRLIK